MSSERQSNESADVLATLIRAGGRREAPPEEAYRIVLAAAESALRDKLRRRRRWRVGLALAAAASVGFLSVLLYPALRQPAPQPARVATIDRLDGLVAFRQSTSEDWTALDSARTVLKQGAQLRTGQKSGAGLIFHEQVSVRLSADSAIELTDLSEIRLQHGTIYVDTGAMSSQPIEVVTPMGIAHHQGTQFELRYLPPTLQLRVREGRVVVDRASGEVLAEAGEGVIITAAGEVTRTAIASHDPAWQWSEALAPMPAFDGQSASVLLEWVARQTGRELRYVDPAAEQRAATAILHGQVGQLAPTEAMEVMLATTNLGFDLGRDDTILVGTR